MILDRLVKRAEMGFSTAKQIRCLENKGFNNVAQWTMEEASKMISRLAMNSWMVPFEINAETYKPASMR